MFAESEWVAFPEVNETCCLPQSRRAGNGHVVRALSLRVPWIAHTEFLLLFPGGASGENPPQCRTRDWGFIPVRKILKKQNPLQYPAWVIPWQRSLVLGVHGVLKSQTWLRGWAHTLSYIVPGHDLSWYQHPACGKWEGQREKGGISLKKTI